MNYTLYYCTLQSLRCDISNNLKRPSPFRGLTLRQVGEILVVMGHKLLVADDSVTIQKVIKLALSSEGYEISAISAGAEIISALKQNVPDVVLIDVSLPDMNAYAVKKQVNDIPELSGVRFVLMYSAFEKIDEEQAERLKFNGRLIKPFDPSNLRKLIADLLGATSAKASVPKQTEADLKVPSLLGLNDLPPVQDMHPILTPNVEVQIDDAVSSSMSLDIPLADQLLDATTASGYAQSDTSEAQNLDVNIGLTDRTQFTEIHQPARNPNQPPGPPPLVEELEIMVPPPMAEQDINTLTESTMQHISGTDTGVGGWSVDESRKLKASGPSEFIKMPSQPIDDGGSTFLSSLEQSSYLKPAEHKMVPPSQTERGNAELSKNSVMPPELPKENSKKTDTSSMSPSALASQMSGVIHQISGDLEEIIRRDLEKSLQPTLEKVIRETIPVIAEALIKKEIDRILADD